jgi:hypothetical protein
VSTPEQPLAGWLAPTDLSKVPAADDATLRCVLITLDGPGKKVKQAALDELIARAVRKAQTRPT